MSRTNLILFLTLLLIVQVHSQAQCGTNPLFQKFGFTGPITATIAQGITTCKSLINIPSCCDIASFNSMQSKIDAVLQSLSSYAGARDKVIYYFRVNVLPELINKIHKLQMVIQNITNDIISPNSILRNSIVNGLPNTSTTTLTHFDYNGTLISMNTSSQSNTTNDNPVYNLTTDYTALTALVNQYPLMKANFESYQKLRAACVVQMAKIQAAAYCLACEPNFESKGLATNGTLTLSTTLQKKIESACFDYFTAAEEQSSLLEAKTMSSSIATVATAMEKLYNQNTTGFQDLSAVASQVTETSQNSLNTDADKPVYLPSSCTRTSCSFLWDGVFSRGEIDKQLLGYGGTFDGSYTPPALRVLREESLKNRFLQSTSGWNVEDDEASVVITFQEDPGNTRNINNNANLISGTLTYCLVFAIVLGV